MGQIARSADRKLIARVNERLTLVVPEGAREIGRSIDVFRSMPGSEVFEATAYLRWKTARGKEDNFKARGTGRGAAAANQALRALLHRLEHPDEAPPLAKRRPAKRAPRKRRPRRRRAAT